jgi:hypothetical protein
MIQTARPLDSKVVHLKGAADFCNKIDPYLTLRSFTVPAYCTGELGRARSCNRRFVQLGFPSGATWNPRKPALAIACCMNPDFLASSIA